MFNYLILLSTYYQSFRHSLEVQSECSSSPIECIFLCSSRFVSTIYDRTISGSLRSSSFPLPESRHALYTSP